MHKRRSILMKILSLCLVFAMVLTVPATAFAASSRRTVSSYNPSSYSSSIGKTASYGMVQGELGRAVIGRIFRTIANVFLSIVPSNSLYVTDVTLSPNATTLIQGSNFTPTVNLSPDSRAKAKTIKWESDKSYVASVKDGRIYAEFPGTATITCTVDGLYRDTIKVTVLKSEIEKYKVTYFANGGTGRIPMDNKVYESGNMATVLSPSNLSKQGYIFGGWNTKADGTGIHYDPNNTLTITRNTSLYAVWIKCPQITSQLNSNIIVPGDEITYTITAEVAETANELIITNEIPAGTTYATNSASGNAIYQNNRLTWTFSSVSKGEVYTVTFTVKVNSDVEPDTQIENHASVNYGHCSVPTNTTINKVVLHEYTIKYDLNGGVGVVSDQIKPYGTAIMVYSSPTKDGYNFVGWKSTEGDNYAVCDYYIANKETTMTAQWEPNSSNPPASDPTMITTAVPITVNTAGYDKVTGDYVETVFSYTVNTNTITKDLMWNILYDIEKNKLDEPQTTKITFGDGITTIAYHALLDSDANEWVFPATLANIETNETYFYDDLAIITVDENNPNYSSDEYGVLYSKDKTKLLWFPNNNPQTEYFISKDVTNIECENRSNRAFTDCYNLKKIIVDKDNPNYSSDECGVLFNKDKTELIVYPFGCEEIDYVIPEGVTNISNFAFRFCETLTSVVIPQSMKTIESFCFIGCYNLTSVTIPNTTANIESYAFKNCVNLKSVSVPSTCVVETDAFPSTCEVTFRELPDPVVKITYYRDGVVGTTEYPEFSVPAGTALTAEYIANVMLNDPSLGITDVIMDSGDFTNSAELGKTYNFEVTCG